MAARIVDPPGLRQSSNVVFGAVKALRAPKRNHNKAQSLIDHIDQTVASLEADVAANTRGDGESQLEMIYLCEAQRYLESLERSREELLKATNRRYGGRFADQWHIIKVIEKSEKQLLDAKLEFQGAGWKVYLLNTNIQNNVRSTALAKTTRSSAMDLISPAKRSCHNQPHFGRNDINKRRRSAAVLVIIASAFF
ncbi:hypothetical protein RSOLAG22IIIB_12895 [Rhizoctonia solani]|uniref:Uncharacterized protein n=1 Tax=Rhizoctonia solani TaxID=456999 RepID=A0A0K6GHA5_9AGAM|nr:hypothetical protein RSOLAG22IIIB_12895 [Rhizoctonia solani]